MMFDSVADFGENIRTSIEHVGQVFLFVMCASTRIFYPLPIRFSRFIQEMYFIGAKSLLLVTLTALFTGMVLGLQGYYTLSKFGSEGLLGGAVCLTLIRELGPVLTALMVAGRAGSSIAAQLGSMRISEQIDALTTMNIHPVRFLVSPKIAASLISIPLLAAIFNIIGILGGYLTGVVMLNSNAGIFMNSVYSSTVDKDIIVGLVKPFIFGFFIIGISSYRGFYCHRLKPGLQGSASISFATTSSVVVSSVVILITDYILTSLLM